MTATSADAAAPLDEAAYLARLAALNAAAWPVGVPRTPVYPHGEIGVPEHLALHAARTPDKPALIFYGREITYAELDRLSDRCAAMLHASGVREGDPVAIYLGNCPQFTIAFLGILKLGAIHVPVNPMFREHELAYELEDSGAEVVIAQDALMPMVRRVAEARPLRRLFSTGLADMAPAAPTIPMHETLTSDRAAAGDATDFLAALDAAGPPPPRRASDLDAPAALNYTGGTTGMPKGCMHTQRHMIYTCATTCQVGTGMTADDVGINFYPLFWIAGEDLGLLIPLFAGATTILLARWDPIAWMTAVERYRATHVMTLVDNAVEVMDHPRAADYDLTSISTAGCSSFVKKLNLDFRARFRALTGATLVEAAWGMTETHTCDSFTLGMQEGGYDLHAQPVFVGLPMPGTAFKVCDFDTGALLPLGAEGELCVRTPSNLKAYWNQPEATAQALRDGWLHTGDIGLIDEEGFLHFLGRRKEMLKVKGMSVFPAEIEALLGRHPAVIGSGVIGRPDAERGQTPVAFVRLDPVKGAGLTAAALEDWCRDAMAAYKRPEIRLVDALPMTATGKVKKEELAALL